MATHSGHVTYRMYALCIRLITKYKAPQGQVEPAPTLVPLPFERGLLVAILSSKNIRYKLRDPDLVYLVLEWNICNILK
jgi:hypothetical protein